MWPAQSGLIKSLYEILFSEDKRFIWIRFLQTWAGWRCFLWDIDTKHLSASDHILETVTNDKGSIFLIFSLLTLLLPVINALVQNFVEIEVDIE